MNIIEKIKRTFSPTVTTTWVMHETIYVSFMKNWIQETGDVLRGSSEFINGTDFIVLHANTKEYDLDGLREFFGPERKFTLKECVKKGDKKTIYTTD